MRILIAAAPLLVLAACQVSEDKGNDQVSISFDENTAREGAADVANTAQNIAGDIANDVEQTADKVANKADEIQADGKTSNAN